MKPRVFGYCRVSTEDQYASHLSIDQQRHQVVEFCAQNGYDLGKDNCRLGEEHISAFKMRFIERPLGKTINAGLERGDHVVIAKVDRAFRNITDAFTTIDLWDKRGVLWHILDLPTGCDPLFQRKFLSDILAFFAEWESKRRGERMADAWASAKRAGRHMGLCHAPWGFRWTGSKKSGTAKLEYYPEERALMQLVWDLWQDGMRIRAIPGHLIRNRIYPADRRPPWSRHTKYQPAQVYHARYVRDMIIVEGQLRYYQEAGLSEEEAAVQWLADDRRDQLPDDGAINKRLKLGDDAA